MADIARALLLPILGGLIVEILVIEAGVKEPVRLLATGAVAVGASFIVVELARRPSVQRRLPVLSWFLMRATRRKLNASLRMPIQRFDASNAYSLGVDMEQVELRRQHGYAISYLTRDRDRDLRIELDRALRPDGPLMVVLDGPSKAGKSRTLFEALKGHPVLSRSLVVAPRDVGALDGLFEPGQMPKRQQCVVLWLDDLEQFIRIGGGLTAALIEAIGKRVPRVVIVATSGGKGVHDLTSDPRLVEPYRDVLRHPRVSVLRLLGSLSPSEASRADAVYEMADAARVKQFGIGETLVALPELMAKLAEERHPSDIATCHEGAAVAWAAVDWRRSGLLRPIPKSVLRTLWVNYLAGGPQDDAAFERGLSWALMPIYRTIAIVASDPEHESALSIYDPIASKVDELNKAINGRSWDRALDVAQPEDSFHMGVAAYVMSPETLENPLARAESAWRKAANGGIPAVAATANFNLGILLEKQNNASEAEVAYRLADEAGYPDAPLNLGVLLQARGDATAAIAAYKRGDERGDRRASFNLGRTLFDSGDLQGAEAAYRRADDAGHGSAAYNLGRILESQGKVAEARSAYLRADERDTPDAANNLGVCLTRIGDFAGAEAAFRRAVAREDKGALGNLGYLLQQLGDLPAAEETYRRGDEAQDSDCSVKLGVLLEQRGDFQGAEAAYRRADERGDGLAAYDLGISLRRRGDMAGAEEAWRRAYERGYADAANNLALAIEERGDLAASREMLDRADNRGSGKAAYNIGLRLLQGGDTPAAEQAFRRATERGELHAANNLGFLLEKRGDVAGAELAYRIADEGGNVSATFNLARLLHAMGDEVGSKSALERVRIRMERTPQQFADPTMTRFDLLG